MSTADTLTCVAFSPNGQKIASGTARSGVTITDILSKNKHKLEMLADRHTHVTAVAWSSDGQKIMSVSPDHTMRCWNATSSHPLGPSFEGHKDVILVAGFLPNSSHAMSLSRDGELLLWDTGSAAVIQQVTVSNAAQTIFVATLSMDSSLLVTSDTREGVAWEIPKCARIAEITLPDIPLLQAAIIPNSRPQVVLAFGDRSFWIWDINTGKHDDARFEGLGEDDIPFAMAASPDGRLLALEIDGDVDHPTHFYDIKGHELTASNMRCTHPFAFSPDGKNFAASSVPSDSKDGSCKLIIRSVEEILGSSTLDFPATTTPRAKGKQRSIGLNPAFFDEPPRTSGSARGRAVRFGLGPSTGSGHQQASPGTTGRNQRILPLPKIWKRIRHPRSYEAQSTVQDAQQQASQESTGRKWILPVGNIWTRMRHRPHETRPPDIVDVPTAQAKRRTVVAGPRKTTSAQKGSAQSSNNASDSSHSQSASTWEGSAQASSDARHTHQSAVASPLRHESSAQNDSAQSSGQAGRRGYAQGHLDRGDQESDDGIVYTALDTESVKAHGCWNIFWNWLCYKAF